MACCQSKSLFGAAVAVAVVVVGLFGFTRTGSYLSTAWTSLRTVAQEQIPPEVELSRIRAQIDALGPDIEKSKSAVAVAKVDLVDLQKDVDAAQAKLGEQKTRILAMSEALERKADKVSLFGQSVPAAEVKRQLKRDLTTYELCEKEVASKRKMLDAKAKSLDAAVAQLAALRQQKQELVVTVAQLDAELKTLRVAETNSKVQVDDSRLADIKSSLADVQRRIDVMKTRQTLDDGDSPDHLVPTGPKAAEDDVLDKVRQKFGEPAKDAVKAD